MKKFLRKGAPFNEESCRLVGHSHGKESRTFWDKQANYPFASLTIDRHLLDNALDLLLFRHGEALGFARKGKGKGDKGYSGKRIGIFLCLVMFFRHEFHGLNSNTHVVDNLPVRGIRQ
jgi:hypothetical protein